MAETSYIVSSEFVGIRSSMLPLVCMGWEMREWEIVFKSKITKGVFEVVDNHG